MTRGIKTYDIILLGADTMICVFCNSNRVNKDGNHNGFQRYRCLDCNKRFDGEKYTTNYIEYFGVKIKDKHTNKLTRDNYCIPTNKTESQERRNIEKAEFYSKNNIKAFIPSYYLNLPNEVFIDKNTYADTWVKQHYEDCMYNYDLNMKYFNNLDEKLFNKKLDSFIKKNKLKQITDLNQAEVSGAYVLVLDEYKQVYIGISYDIKKRILSHWNNKKEFGRLIFGSKDTSVISIDSFGAFDTTRVFIKKSGWYQNINRLEEELVSKFDDKYTLNRIRGGLNSEIPDALRTVAAIGSMKKRDF